MRALLDELAQFGTKGCQIGELPLYLEEMEVSNPVNLGAGLLTVVRQPQQLPHLVQ